ncbi:MAG: leucine-rich repeat domain-containing protein [Verrucomicrobiota bacterium]
MKRQFPISLVITSSLFWVVLPSLFNVACAQVYDFAKENGGAIITGYHGPGGIVSIPREVEGVPVTGIGKACFKPTGGALSISTSYVNGTAISRYVNYSVFVTCIIIPDSVKTIGASAFSHCTSLTNIIIPDSVTNIGYQVAEDCANLDAITVDPGNSAYCSIDGVLFNKSHTWLIAFPEGRKKNTYSYMIPNGVTGIYLESFEQCFCLTNITIPGTVNRIITSSLHIPSLVSIAVAANNPDFSSVDGVLFNKDKTIMLSYPCARTGRYTVPNSVVRIRKDAFFDCSGLTGITIGNGVTNIEAGAFSSCRGLANIIVGDHVVDIGNAAFGNCPDLTGIYFMGAMPHFGYNVFNGSDKVVLYYLSDAKSWKRKVESRPAKVWKR